MTWSRAQDERMMAGFAERVRYDEASQARQNEAYGMQLRIAGMKRRGESQEKIDALQKKYDELTKTMKGSA